jgi:methanethiol S-methyltransferase
MKRDAAMERELVPPAGKTARDGRPVSESADSPATRTGAANRWEKAWAYAMVAAAASIGLGSLCLFILFPSMKGLPIRDMKMGWRSVLAWDAALCLVFFAQHSGMVRRSFRDWLGKLIPAYCHGAIYTVASGAALVLLAVCWLPAHVNVLNLVGAVRWLILGLNLLACVGIMWCFRALGAFDILGIRAILSHLRREPPRATPFIIRGPYRWVRHPVYFFVIVAFWACPSLSLDRIVFNVLFTAWIASGAALEERELVFEFGYAYRTYQRKVPMLLPRRLTPAC